MNCGQIEVFAGLNATDRGFVSCLKFQFLPWTIGGADLTPFIGQQITLEFIALDCTLGQHGGYAYVDASLQPLKIKVEDFCNNGDTITLIAPLGFSNYLWSNGEETRSITITDAQFGDMYSVDFFSNTGCFSELSIMLEPVPNATINPIPNEEICIGGNTLLQPTGNHAGDFRFMRPDPTNPGGFIETAPNGLSALLTPTEDTTYTIIARDEYGCDGPSTNFTVTVTASDGPPFPKADFTMEPLISSDDTPCNTIQLTNLSAYCKDGLSYLWNFGDGSTSTQFSPLHTFPVSAGEESYIVTLTITAEDGLTASKSLEYRAYITAQFTSSTPECETITLTNSSGICGSFIDSFSSFAYTWDFGDGNPSVTTNGSEPSVMHTYTNSGEYTITLTITNPDNPSLVLSTYMETVSITIETVADFDFVVDCFDVTFQDNSLPCNPIESYSWDFGDGSPVSNELNPTHTYMEAGQYAVVLSVKDGTQNFSQTHDITINPDQTIPNFEFDINCDVVRFTELTNSCKDYTYQWDFGDGTDLSSVQNPVHTYEPDNTYNVILTLNDGAENFSITKPISIKKQFVYELPRELISCTTSNMSDTATFDLAEQRDHILQNIDKTISELPVVSFHPSINDAFNNNKTLPLAFTNTANPQTLYARVEDNNSCLNVFPFSITAYNTPTVNTIDDIFLCYLKENVIGYDLSQLNARVFEGIEQTQTNLSYHLFEDDAIQGLNGVTEINLSAGLDITIYVRAENTLNNKCFSINTFSIRMDNDNTDESNRCMPFFANTMTPNGDGINDAFYIKNIESFPNNKLTIYNRWGNIVYKTTSYQNNWYGTYNGQPLPVGNYYYYFELNGNDNRSASGYITILR